MVDIRSLLTMIIYINALPFRALLLLVSSLSHMLFWQPSRCVHYHSNSTQSVVYKFFFLFVIEQQIQNYIWCTSCCVQRSMSELSAYQKKIFPIDDHVGCSIAGLTSDGRLLRYTSLYTIAINPLLTMLVQSVYEDRVFEFTVPS